MNQIRLNATADTPDWFQALDWGYLSSSGNWRFGFLMLDCGRVVAVDSNAALENKEVVQAELETAMADHLELRRSKNFPHLPHFKAVVFLQ